MKINIKLRLAKDRLLKASVCFFAALTAVPLFAILGEVLLRGYDQLSWSFFTEPTPTAYKAMKAIPANTDLDSTYLGSPITGGMVNELNSNLTNALNGIVFEHKRYSDLSVTGGTSVDLETFNGKIVYGAFKGACGGVINYDDASYVYVRSNILYFMPTISQTGCYVDVVVAHN